MGRVESFKNNIIKIVFNVSTLKLGLLRNQRKKPLLLWRRIGDKEFSDIHSGIVLSAQIRIKDL